jgi:hypothetical protein
MNDAFALILMKSLWAEYYIKKRKERPFLKEDRKGFTGSEGQKPLFMMCMWQINFNYLKGLCHQLYSFFKGQYS